MDKKTDSALMEFFDNLTDGQKEKAKECKTMDELMDFAGKEGIELPDDLLDNVAGGFVPDWTPVTLEYFTYDPSKNKNNP